MSDIFGTAVERYKRPERSDWTLGEDTGEISRSMSNPNAYEQPGEYGGKFFYSIFGSENASDNGGVHRLSGIMNRWFYLLCEGGKGTTESGFAYNVTPIGIADALKIVYLAQTDYITPGMNYYNVSLATYRAARAIFGTDAKQTKQVENAWGAVNVVKSRIFESCGNDVHEPNNTYTTGTRIGVDRDVEGNFADFVSSTYNRGDLSKIFPQSEAAKYRDWYQFTTTNEKPNFKIAMENYVNDNIVLVVYKDKIDDDHRVTFINGPVGGGSSGKKAGFPDPKTLHVSTESDPYNNVKAHTYYLVVAASSSAYDISVGEEYTYRYISQPSQGCYSFKVVTSAKPYITQDQFYAQNQNQLVNKKLVWFRNAVNWTESNTDSRLVLGLADEKQTAANAPVVCRAFSNYSDQIWQITNSSDFLGDGTYYNYNLKNLNTDKVMEIAAGGNVIQNDYNGKLAQRFTLLLDGFSAYGPLYWNVSNFSDLLLSVVNVKATAPNTTKMQVPRAYTDPNGTVGNDAPQVWVIDPVTTLPGEGEYLIRSVNDKGQFLSFPANKSLQTTAITEGLEQRWTIKPTQDGRYTLVNRLSGQSLVLATSSASEGITYTRVATNPSQATQNWKILPTGPDKSFKIVNSFSNKPITVQTNRSVTQNNYTGSDNQRWYVERVKPLKEGYYYLQNRATGLYMDVAGASKDNGATLISYPYRGSYNQLFYVQPQTDGTYIIENVTSEKNLSINSQNALAQPYQWEADANKVNHRWQITYTTDGYFKVISKFSGQALQAGTSAGESGIKSPIVQNNYRLNDPYKQWNFRILGSVVDKTVQTLASTTESVSAEKTAVLTIFPNPAQNQVTVAYPLADGEQAQIKLLNLTGIELMNQPAQATQTVLDVSQLGTGLYLINLQTNTGKRLVQKLIINK